MNPATHTMTLPGPMLMRGFWLYVWRVETPFGEMLYIGRTGDNSSPNASAPYTRMGQHLGTMKNQNALRRNLVVKGVDPEECASFTLIAHGPIFPEIDKPENQDRAALMERHKPFRNLTGAMEKALADDLVDAGYTVLNQVRCKFFLDEDIWRDVRRAFSEHFPALYRA